MMMMMMKMMMTMMMIIIIIVIPLAFRDSFYFGNALPHKHSYHVQMWRDGGFRRETCFLVSSFELNEFHFLPSKGD